jgi:ribosomal protein S18 acetylase RimI-like enzyme
MISLRTADRNDYSFLEDLRRQAMRAVVENHYPWNEDFEKERVLVEFKHARIILCDDASVGLWKVVRRKDHIDLLQIQILPSYQRKGIGRALISGLQKKAQDEGSLITLHVFRSNPAIRLYSRLEFQGGCPKSC